MENDGAVTEQGLRVFPDVLSVAALSRAKQEVERLRPLAEQLSIPGYATYKHVKPNVVQQQQSWLLDLYHSDDMKQLISHAVGKKVHTVPLEQSDGFNINCKINYYSDNRYPLQWHYDTFNEFKGDTVICVLTIQFETAEPPHVPVERTDQRGVTTLTYLDRKGTKQNTSLTQNTMTVHLAKSTFHKVWPLPKGYRRTIFIMKYSTDPTPRVMPLKLRNTTVALKNGVGFGILYRWPLLLAVAVGLAFLVVRRRSP